MVIGEGQRRALHDRLVEVLGVPEADLLMEHLPPSGWGDVARRGDLDQLERILRTDMESMRVELRGEFAELRGDVRGEIGQLRGDMAKQTRTVIIAMASIVTSLMVALVVAVLTVGR